jgi:hypothetical protein
MLSDYAAAHRKTGRFPKKDFVIRAMSSSAICGGDGNKGMRRIGPSTRMKALDLSSPMVIEAGLPGSNTSARS